MANPFFTIGHSTRPLATFIELLKQAGVRRVVDVRTVPKSRKNPQYNVELLPRSLAAAGIGHEHIAALGGLRARQLDVSPAVNAFWENDSFHNYADYAMGEAFGAGFERLLDLGTDEVCAVMCAEALWWRCHRRIIADYLLASGEDVFHILGPDNFEPAQMTPAAIAGPGRTLTYPAAAAQQTMDF